MQILLANAKIMFDKADRKPISVPHFSISCQYLAEEMARMDVDELASQLDCSSKIATENRKRYHNFIAERRCLLFLAYNGQAYKHLRASSLGEESLSMPETSLDYLFPLWLTSTDGWRRTSYRMEHCVSLEATNR